MLISEKITLWIWDRYELLILYNLTAAEELHPVYNQFAQNLCAAPTIVYKSEFITATTDNCVALKEMSPVSEIPISKRSNSSCTKYVFALFYFVMNLRLLITVGNNEEPYVHRTAEKCGGHS
jgi:hypothetical protein